MNIDAIRKRAATGLTYEKGSGEPIKHVKLTAEERDQLCAEVERLTAENELLKNAVLSANDDREAAQAEVTRLRGAGYAVESVEWSHPNNDIPEGSTRLVVRGVIQTIGAGDTIAYHRADAALRGTP